MNIITMPTKLPTNFEKAVLWNLYHYGVANVYWFDQIDGYFLTDFDDVNVIDKERIYFFENDGNAVVDKIKNKYKFTIPFF